jgi:hypothetical protein
MTETSLGAIHFWVWSQAKPKQREEKKRKKKKNKEKKEEEGNEPILNEIDL